MKETWKKVFLTWTAMQKVVWLFQLVRLRESFLKFSDQKKKQPNRKIELSFYSI